MDDTSQILTAMRNGVDHRFPVVCRKLTVRLRPLSIMEETEIEAETYDLLMKLPENKRTKLMETRLLAVKSLQLASTSSPGQNDFQLTQMELDGLTADELQFLWKQFTLGMAKYNPALEYMPQDEILELAKSLKKNPSTLIEQSSSVILNLAHLALTLEDKPLDN